MKRKIFVKTDLSLPQVRNNSAANDAGTAPRVKNPVVKLPSSVDGQNSFDFSRWHGCGIDSVTDACQEQIERFIANQDAELAATTVTGYCQNGLTSFLDYLVIAAAASEVQIEVKDIDRSVIDGYLTFLRYGNTSSRSQSTVYYKAKGVLLAMGKRGVFKLVRSGDEATFPANPFPGRRTGKGAKPLTSAQRKAFALALQDALQPLFVQDAVVTGELLAYSVLYVALHTGRNTTPLLEMSTACLRQHPKDDTMFLVLYKRRARKFSKVALRSSRWTGEMIEGTGPVNWNVVTLINRVLQLTKDARDNADAALKDRLWLYPTQLTVPSKNRKRGETRVLLQGEVTRCVRQLEKRYKLQDSDGKPLRVNIGVLRKSFINRISELVKGDLAITARAAGNTPQVAANHYLRPGEHAEKNWRFMGHALTEELLGSKLGSTYKTPVGKCSDVKAGEYAPKRDGATCMSFLNCVRCRNYVVTGDDLYRLFSFYWRVLLERNKIDRRRWDKQFAHIVRLIDRDIIAEGLKNRVFNSKQVDEAREKARVEPHPFWKPEQALATLTT